MSQGHVHWVHEFLKCVFHGQFQTMKEAQNEANPWVIFLKQPDKTRVCTTVYSCTIWQQQQKKTSWEQVPGNVVWKLSEWFLYKTRGNLEWPLGQHRQKISLQADMFQCFRVRKHHKNNFLLNDTFVCGTVKRIEIEFTSSSFFPTLFNSSLEMSIMKFIQGVSYAPV